MSWYNNTEAPERVDDVLVETIDDYIVGFYAFKGDNKYFFMSHPGDDRCFKLNEIKRWRYLTPEEKIINNYWLDLY